MKNIAYLDPKVKVHFDYTSHSETTLAPARSIEVLSIQPSEAPGLLATVAVRCGGILFRDVSVTNRGRGTFVNFPSRKVDGVWIELVEFTSTALRTAVVEVILAAVRAWAVTR